MYILQNDTDVAYVLSKLKVFTRPEGLIFYNNTSMYDIKEFSKF